MTTQIPDDSTSKSYNTANSGSAKQKSKEKPNIVNQEIIKALLGNNVDSKYLDELKKRLDKDRKSLDVLIKIPNVTPEIIAAELKSGKTVKEVLKQYLSSEGNKTIEKLPKSDRLGEIQERLKNNRNILEKLKKDHKYLESMRKSPHLTPEMKDDLNKMTAEDFCEKYEDFIIKYAVSAKESMGL